MNNLEKLQFDKYHFGKIKVWKECWNIFLKDNQVEISYKALKGEINSTHLDILVDMILCGVIILNLEECDFKLYQRQEQQVKNEDIINIEYTEIKSEEEEENKKIKDILEIFYQKYSNKVRHKFYLNLFITIYLYYRLITSFN